MDAAVEGKQLEEGAPAGAQVVKEKKVVGMKEPEVPVPKDSGKAKKKSPKATTTTRRKTEPVRIPRALSAVGFLTLECESETNLSIGSVLQIFNNNSDGSPKEAQKAGTVLDSTLFTVDGLAKLLEEKLLPRYERFSMVPNRSSKSWVPPSPSNSSVKVKPPSPSETKASGAAVENAFDVRNHIHELYLPASDPEPSEGEAGEGEDGEDQEEDADRQEVLREALSKLISTELDPELPAWDVHIIKNWTRPALFWRIHHCIGDGQSVATALLSISDRAKEIIKVTTKKLPTPPDGFLVKLTFYLWIIFGTVAVFLRWAYLHFFFPRPPPLFSRSLISKEKRVAFDCEAIAVDRVMAVAKHFRVTFNDVMLSCMAGAIGKMMRDQNEEPVEFPIGMPVNLRTTPFPKKTGNHIGSYSIYLPTNITDPVKRLKKIHRRTNGMKRLPEQYVTYGMSLICARLPGWASTRIFSNLASHIGAVITNVRGPEQELIYEGQKVHGLVGFVPPPVGVRLGFAVASYAGRVMVSVSGDVNLCHEIGQYVTYFIEEFNECEDDFKRLQEQERQPEKEFIGQTWQTE